ncbi:hypothetical protein [Nitrosomonas ureae]|uniref:Uncharacterized protein n=1 Tax=Nitrosomonas ureae TaxID=44577 RepID=A0A2T5ISS3_9PROT|nr:hypothetical protein [Nitrosomonas ureae]PTQ86884.1 hypothetical protein C8R28_100879 [Nitrosomonas ureae]
MAAKPKLTQEEWEAVRIAWESDPREGYSWLVKELNLPVSRPAIGKVAAREFWKKTKVTQESETINESAVEKPSKAKPHKAYNKKEPVKITKVTQNDSETISETMEKLSKKKEGKPSLFKEEYIDQVYKLCMLGATDKELADFFNIAESTLNLWKKEYPLFMESLTRGKTMADADMAVSLYKRGIGYSHPETHVSNYRGEITLTELTKHYPPETGAAFLWLKNRQPKKWKDKIVVKEEINLNIFPPAEELDAIYEKALAEAARREEVIRSRRERLGFVIDNDSGDIVDLGLD